MARSPSLSAPRAAFAIGLLLAAGVAAGERPARPTRTGAAPPSPVVPLAPQDPPLGRPTAIVDLSTAEGARLVKGQWRYSDVSIREVTGKALGPDLKPSGKPIQTYDYFPKAGGAGYDDSKWQVIGADTLEQRRSTAKVCFNWYRIKVTIPERVGACEPTGSTVAFEVVVDDYAEVWVDGKLSRNIGQSGGAVVRGFNAPNRVLLTRDARPGQSFQIALFGINGPISNSPENFIWVKSATLDFHAPRAASASPNVGSVERLDPGLDAAVPVQPKIERLAAGFQFTEGPAWNAEEGSLFFSDPNQNTIYRYETDGALSVFRPKSGYRGLDIGEYKQPGSNGLAFDASGRLTINEHGNRRVTRLEKNGSLTVLADSYQGKRLNSPNDLVYRSDGALYFSDPPFGLPQVFDDPRKELPFSGIYRFADGKLTLLNQELLGPNGLAFSPDEKYLYVDNWDPKRKVVMRYPVQADGALGVGSVFLDATSARGEEAFDGLKVDALGDVFVSGPGGVWVLSPTGKHLGTIHAPELPANFAWGDADRKTLYMTARTGIYRMRVNAAGATAFGPHGS